MNKNRLTLEEKETLTKMVKSLPPFPMIDPTTGAVIWQIIYVSGKNILARYGNLIRDGYDLPKKGTIQLTMVYQLKRFQFANLYDRFKRALFKGKLDEEIQKYNLEFALFTKANIDGYVEKIASGEIPVSTTPKEPEL